MWCLNINDELTIFPYWLHNTKKQDFNTENESSLNEQSPLFSFIAEKCYSLFIFIPLLFKYFKIFQ